MPQYCSSNARQWQQSPKVDGSLDPSIFAMPPGFPTNVFEYDLTCNKNDNKLPENYYISSNQLLATTPAVVENSDVEPLRIEREMELIRRSIKNMEREISVVSIKTTQMELIQNSIKTCLLKIGDFEKKFDQVERSLKSSLENMGHVIDDETFERIVTRSNNKQAFENTDKIECPAIDATQSIDGMSPIQQSEMITSSINCWFENYKKSQQANFDDMSTTLKNTCKNLEHEVDQTLDRKFNESMQRQLDQIKSIETNFNYCEQSKNEFKQFIKSEFDQQKCYIQSESQQIFDKQKQMMRSEFNFIQNHLEQLEMLDWDQIDRI